MIDAYEIGIQLALQDDVSAGLQLISRELAEVDRAIQATSANLVSLEHVAEGALGPSVAGVKLAGGGGEKAEKVARPEPEVGSGGAARPLPGVLDPAPRSSPPLAGSVEVTSARAPAAPAAAKDRADISTPPSPLREPADTAATVAPPRREPFVQEAFAADGSRDTTAPVAVAPPVAPASQLRSDGDGGPAAPVASPSTIVSRIAAPERLGGDPTAHRESRVTASVAHTVISRSADGAKDRVAAAQVRMVDPMTSAASKAAAPWSGVEMRVTPQRAEGAMERPTAPARRTADRAEGVSGNIMLDGHLVGYWLSEQMAKEASRPPSGTSFFDPRQSPAWTASGSL